jgi:hypothetical protein
MTSPTPIYKTVLGEDFETLPPQVQALHNSIQTRAWGGTAKVQRGTGVLAKALAAIIGFPETDPAKTVRVDFVPDGVGERWTRTFGAKTFSSYQRPNAKGDTPMMMERFGVINVALALQIKGDRMYLIPKSWSCLGIPLPRFLLPEGESFETERNGKFCFDVEIAAPLIGLIVSYKGQLTPITA